MWVWKICYEMHACERHHVRLRMTHTLGALLDRPDEISRQVGVEEPRARLRPSVFAALERSLGPFTSFVGPERDLATRFPSDSSTESVWVHPAYTSVAAALRLLSARASAALQDGRRFR